MMASVPFSNPIRLSLISRVTRSTGSRSTRAMSTASPAQAGPSRIPIPIIRTLEEMRAWRRFARERGKEVGIVPTVSSLLALRGRSPSGPVTLVDPLAQDRRR